MSSSTNDRALGWDDEFVAPKGANAILEADVPHFFKVASIEKGFHERTEHLCACPQANVVLHVMAANGDQADIKESFPLNEKMLRKLLPFLKSIGSVAEDVKEGDKFRVDWNIEGKEGFCTTKPHTFKGKNGDVTINRIDEYLVGGKAAKAKEEFSFPVGIRADQWA